VQIAGTFVLKTIHSLQYSFPGQFVPWNFDSRYPGPFLPRTIRSFVSRAVWLAYAAGQLTTSA